MPSNGDSIVIPSGKSIRVTTQLDFSGGAAMKLNVAGDLTFQTGKKLILPSGSTITLQVGGNIIPGNGNGNSNTITIGTTMVWNAGMGTVTGYLYWPVSTLPVTLIEFKSSVSNHNGVELHWATSSEVNNDYFDVERSEDGSYFESIGTVDGHGTTSSGYKYYFTDRSPHTGENYYRLRQVDFDSKFHYSAVIRCLNNLSEEFEPRLFPNPSKGDVFITTPSSSEIQNANLIISDSKANVVFEKVILIPPGSEGILVSGNDSKIKPGIYFVSIIIGEKHSRNQLVIY